MVYLIIIPIIIYLLGVLMIMEHPITKYGVMALCLFAICVFAIFVFLFADGEHQDFNFIIYFILIGYIPMIIASKRKKGDQNDDI